MDLKKAIRERVSRRSYLETPVAELHLEKLRLPPGNATGQGGFAYRL